jgi:acetoin utilization deacetylase AcuC-like enzyme
MQHAGQADLLLVLLERIPAGGTKARVEKGDNIVQYPCVHRERRTRIADIYYIRIKNFLNKNRIDVVRMDLYTKTGVAEIHYRNWLDFVPENGRILLPKLANFH